MKRTLIFAVAVVLLLTLIGCTMNRPVCATSNPIGSKVGVYTQTSILGFPPVMNKQAATAQAALNGGITKISTVDFNIHWMVFILKYETVVRGE